METFEQFKYAVRMGMKGSDFLLILPFLILVFAIAYYIKETKYKDHLGKSYFLPAIALKLFGAFFFAVIYQFYYNFGGDTFGYFHDGWLIRQAFLDDPALGWEMLKHNEVIWPNDRIYKYANYIWHEDLRGYSMARLCFLVNIISFNSYLLSTLYFALFAFSGVWMIFWVFDKLYPGKTKWFALGILFIPSVVFWGGGILKDTVCLGCIGWAVYALYNLVVRQKKIILSIIIFALSIFVCSLLKVYIILGFLPAMVLWIYLRGLSRVKNQALKMALKPLMIVLLLGASYIFIQRVGQTFERYRVENLEEVIKGFHSWHTTLGGSSYSLGDVSFTPTGLLKVFPKAVNVTYYRPYLWEAGSPVMLISAVESLGFLLFTIWTLFKVGLGRFIRYLFTNAEVLFCFTFSVVFGFVIGFTAYNFGALVRYKVPSLAFFMAGLIIIHILYEREMAKKRNPEETE